MIEFQSKWVAKVLSGKSALPSEEDMVASVNEVYAKMEALQKPKRHTHFLSAHEVINLAFPKSFFIHIIFWLEHQLSFLPSSLDIWTGLLLRLVCRWWRNGSCRCTARRWSLSCRTMMGTATGGILISGFRNKSLQGVNEPGLSELAVCFYLSRLKIHSFKIGLCWKLFKNLLLVFSSFCSE